MGLSRAIFPLRTVEYGKSRRRRRVELKLLVFWPNSPGISGPARAKPMARSRLIAPLCAGTVATALRTRLTAARNPWCAGDSRRDYVSPATLAKRERGVCTGGAAHRADGHPLRASPRQRHPHASRSCALRPRVGPRCVGSPAYRRRAGAASNCLCYVATTSVSGSLAMDRDILLTILMIVAGGLAVPGMRWE